MPELHELEPDWTLAPDVMLREWMGERDLTPEALAVRCGRGEADLKAHLLIRDVLERKPLTESCAEMLERGTGISKGFWLNYEHNYRDDLAAGRKDVSGPLYSEEKR